VLERAHRARIRAFGDARILAITVVATSPDLRRSVITGAMLTRSQPELGGGASISSFWPRAPRSNRAAGGWRIWSSIDQFSIGGASLPPARRAALNQTDRLLRQHHLRSGYTL